MYIILKQTQKTTEIMNMFYGEDITSIRLWIKERMEEEIKSLNLAPLEQDIKQVTYTIEEFENYTFKLIKNYKKTNRGYIYNSSDKLSDVLYTISIVEYDGENKWGVGLADNANYTNINNEINNRVLKQLDKESLYQVFIKLQSSIMNRKTWNKTEYTGLIAEVVRNFKKELYSSIAKRLKRFGKQQAAQQAAAATQHKWEGSCKLEMKSKLD
jgi:hypothetical protein